MTCNAFRLACCLALLAAAAPPVTADVLHLKSGGRIEGRIVERTETSVEIELGAGTMTLPLTSVARIEEGRSVLDEYDERRAQLAVGDTAGWLALAEWSARHGLSNQARAAYRHVLVLDPRNETANRALGFVEYDGRWMTEDEAYAARGYVKHRGQWMTREERIALEHREAAEATAEKARAEAKRAEAAARRAEASARQAQAEADARQRDERYPVYWPGWSHRPGHRPPPRPQPPARPPSRPSAPSVPSGSAPLRSP
ncbi:MAG TPA: hypothetical protein VLT59_17295 [Steroidobacteraceae bacterium]|nr:hypothetical protein [Steroidobacteraceae bacterium]